MGDTLAGPCVIVYITGAYPYSILCRKTRCDIYFSGWGFFHKKKKKKEKPLSLYALLINTTATLTTSPIGEYSPMELKPTGKFSNASWIRSWKEGNTFNLVSKLHGWLSFESKYVKVSEFNQLRERVERLNCFEKTKAVISRVITKFPETFTS